MKKQVKNSPAKFHTICEGEGDYGLVWNNLILSSIDGLIAG